MKRRVICMMLAATMLLTACGSVAKASTITDENEEVLDVDVISPETKSISVMTEYIGSLEAQSEVSVIPKMSGIVDEVHFEVGDHVEAGDLLFAMDDEAAQMQVENAKATYDTAVAGANQSIGGIDVQRSSAENNLATANDAIKTTLNTCDGLSDSYSDAQEQIDDLKDDKDDLKDAVKKSEKYLSKVSTASKLIGKLQSLASQYAAAVASDDEGQAERLKDDFNKYYSQVTGGGTTEDPSASHAVEYNAFIAETTGNPILTINDLASELASAKAAASSANTALNSVENGIDSLEAQQDAINDNKESVATSYDQAVRGRDLAQKNLDYFNNYTAPATAQTAEATLKQAKVGVESAQLQLDYTRVTAPVSGVITAKNVDKYEMAQAGMPSYVIKGDDGLKVVFFVTEDAMKNITQGQQVVVEKDGTQYEATVSMVGSTVDPQKGLFKIEASFGSGVSDSFIEGTSVKISTSTKRSESVMTIPVNAVYYDSEQAFVYCAENGKAVKVYVELGISDDTDIEVLSGLSEGAQIITTWASDLRDGAVISIGGKSAVDESATDDETVSTDTVIPDAGEAAVSGSNAK